MHTPLPPLLETKLADFRRRVWVVKLAEGLLAAAFGILLSYLLVFALDRFMETPSGLRLGLLLAGAATLGLGLPWKWHRWVWRQRRLEDAARLLRRKFPRLGDQLLGIVELAHADSAAGRSERLVRAAIDQAAEAVKDRDFTQAVPEARHREWAWAAGGSLAVTICALVFVSDAARNAIARWLLPWRPIERYTFARVEPLPKQLVVPYAEAFALPVKLAAETRWSPASGTGRIARQPRVEVPLTDGVYPLTFPPQKDDATLAVSLGDLRQAVLVQPRVRPELESLAVRLKLPAYLQYQTEPRLEVHGASVTVLKGAEASFEAKASRALASATVDGAAQPVEGQTILTNYQPMAKDAEFHLAWSDRDGLTPREPLVLKVHAAEDEPPSVVARRDSLEQVVLDSEVVTFEVTAGDDFGVKRVGLEWVGSEMQEDGKTPVRGDKVTAGGAPEQKQLESRATFCATRDGVAPQTLEVRAWAEDYLPGRARPHSATFVLQILNKTDHALWLTEQFGKWLEAARESYEHEQQLHQTNEELRALSAEELDRPENRRKVSQQAAAENSSAARVDGLTAAGRSLVEQATKNDEFDARRLEAWADMLRTLKDIAANRMPSVSDLLKQSAGAQGAKPNGASPKPGAPNAGSSSKTAQANQAAGADSKQGGAKSSDSGKTAQNGEGSKPSDAKPGETKPGESKQGEAQSGNTPKTAQATDAKPSEQAQPSENKSAPALTQGKPPEANPGGGQKPPGAGVPQAPSITMQESSMSKPGEQKAGKPAPPSPGKLSLPQDTLAAAPNGKKDEKPEDAAEPESPAQEKLGKAVTEQKDLLAEFAKVSDQLSEILGSLEASTFVKRLKNASKEQINLAETISQKTLDAFGIERASIKAAPPIAKRAKDQSEVVRTIESDLDAYYQRKQDNRYKTILEQMKKTEIVQALARGGEKITVNLNGQSLNGSEYWADTLDRWAEELVSASESKKSSKKAGSKESLPPEVVLRVMQALREEMALRDETREAENSKPVIKDEKYNEIAKALAIRQTKNANRVDEVVSDVSKLPKAQENFGDELKLLKSVIPVMDEGRAILDEPETGARAVAAETDAIELLLQAKRQGKKPGGGGGSNPGGGGTADTATLTALSELGPGSDAKSTVVSRSVGQATGHAGKEFPAEFKAGLESYFNLLEKQPAGR